MTILQWLIRPLTKHLRSVFNVTWMGIQHFFKWAKTPIRMRGEMNVRLIWCHQRSCNDLLFFICGTKWSLTYLNASQLRKLKKNCIEWKTIFHKRCLSSEKITIFLWFFLYISSTFSHICQYLILHSLMWRWK